VAALSVRVVYDSLADDVAVLVVLNGQDRLLTYEKWSLARFVKFASVPASRDDHRHLHSHLDSDRVDDHPHDASHHSPSIRQQQRYNTDAAHSHLHAHPNSNQIDRDQRPHPKLSLR
jgi:hypothetical protein